MNMRRIKNSLLVLMLTLTTALCAQDLSGIYSGFMKVGTPSDNESLTALLEFSKEPQYGSDATAGHYVQTSDAKIYYERYGDGGRPLVLLHGGEYGYIDEFGELIREMGKRHTVIATRGYGRSIIQFHVCSLFLSQTACIV